MRNTSEPVNCHANVNHCRMLLMQLNVKLIGISVAKMVLEGLARNHQSIVTATTVSNYTTSVWGFDN